jgi:hypothetical protein
MIKSRLSIVSSLFGQLFYLLCIKIKLFYENREDIKKSIIERNTSLLKMLQAKFD